MRKDCRYRSLEKLPILLSYEDLVSFLGLSKCKVYDLLNDDHFPTITIGSRMFVLKDSLLLWLNVHENKKDEKPGNRDVPKIL